MAAFAIMNILPSPTSLLLIVSSLGLYLAYFHIKTYSYWKKRGVPYMKPLPFFGNMKDVIFRKVPLVLLVQQLYTYLDGHKFGGFYLMSKPAMIIRDPELVRVVLIKKFPHFHDRLAPGSDNRVEPLQNHLPNLVGKRWRNVRYKLSPAFSSAKLRGIEHLMEDCIRELDKHLTKVTSDNSKTKDGLELQELMCRFTMDVIGTCILGFQCNSIRDEDSEFWRIGKIFFSPNYRRYAGIVLRTLCPWLKSLLKFKSIKPEAGKFFQSVMKQALVNRVSTGYYRDDFLQLLISTQVKEKEKLLKNDSQKSGHNQKVHQQIDQKDILFTDDIVASHVFVFYPGGFETLGNALSFCIYELALNPEICEKMRDEVETVKRAHNGDLDYDAKKELIYVNAVISETLRKYPVMSFMIRHVTEAFQIPKTSLVLEKGTAVVIPVYGLHHDPKYFPDPEKFLPERFNQDNIGSIVPGTYLPFGDGPRICFAMRFALLEMKSVLAYLVSNYTFHPCKKTAVPPKYDSRIIPLTPVNGIWVQFQKIPRG